MAAAAPLPQAEPVLVNVKCVDFDVDDLERTRLRICDEVKAPYPSLEDLRFYVVALRFPEGFAALDPRIAQVLALPPRVLPFFYMADRTTISEFLQAVPAAMFFNPASVERPWKNMDRKWRTDSKYLLKGFPAESPANAQLLTTSISTTVANFTRDYSRITSTHPPLALRLVVVPTILPQEMPPAGEDFEEALQQFWPPLMLDMDE